MTTENIVQDTEESRIAQQKRETLHSLLYIMAECAPSAEKFMGIDVKALARKVNEAYDQLGNNYTVEADPAANPLAGLVVPGNNVLAMHAGSTGVAEGVNLGSSFKASKKEYAKFPEPAEELKAGTPTVLIALPAGAGMSLTPEQASFNLPEGISTGQISDGYHTFDELYAHRVRLFSTLMRAHPDKSWWSFKHHDGSVWDGWIIAGIDTPAGPATYHLPVSEIEFFNEGVRQLRRGKEWDGHTADDVLERLKSL